MTALTLRTCTLAASKPVLVGPLLLTGEFLRRPAFAPVVYRAAIARDAGVRSLLVLQETLTDLTLLPAEFQYTL